MVARSFVRSEKWMANAVQRVVTGAWFECGMASQNLLAIPKAKVRRDQPIPWSTMIRVIHTRMVLKGMIRDYGWEIMKPWIMYRRQWLEWDTPNWHQDAWLQSSHWNEVVRHGLLMKLQVWRHLVQARRADNGPNLLNTYIL